MQPDARQSTTREQRRRGVSALVDDRQEVTADPPGTGQQDHHGRSQHGGHGELGIQGRLGADDVVGDPLENVADAQSSSILGRTCSQTSLVQAAGSSPIGIMVTVVIPSAAYAAISLRKASVSLSGSTTLIIVFSMTS